MYKLVLRYFISTYCFGVIILKTASQSALIKNVQLRHTHRRVLDGQDIEDGEYPFAVIMFAFDLFRQDEIHRICTASTIAENWVITAAHCVHALRGFPIKIWYGNFTEPPSKTKLYSDILETFIHPGFREIDMRLIDTVFLDNDISLLRVQSIYLKRYGRLSSVDHSTLIGFPATYVGSGLTVKLGDDFMRPLQLGEGAIVTCDPILKEMIRYLICITPKCSQKQSRTLDGDSGGPLLYDGKIIGVLSCGQDSEFNANNGFAPVSPYIDWIHEVMRQKK